jgi:membrane protein
MSTATELLNGARRSKPWRAWTRYGDVRGNVLAGGIAYFAFFSMLPALAVAFTVLGLVAGNRPELQTSIIDYVNDSFGGQKIIGEAGSDQGVVTIDTLVRGNVLSLTLVIALATALFTGLGWVGALRDGVSAVFARVEGPNPVLAKLGDLLGLVSFGTAALASMAGSVVVTSATGSVLSWLGLDRSTLASVLVSAVTSLVVLVIDTALFLILFRLLAGVRLPWEDLFTGALIGGVAFGLLKLFGGLLLKVSTRNGLFAAVVIVAGLLIWMNLAARIALLAAAWSATTAEDRGHLPSGPDPVVRPVLDRPADRVGTVTVGVRGVPTYSARAADRTTLAAGAVLGVTAAIGLRVLARATGTVRDALRRDDHRSND